MQNNDQSARSVNDSILGAAPELLEAIKSFLVDGGRTINALHNLQLPDGSHPMRRFAAELIKASEPMRAAVAKAEGSKP